MVQPPKPLVCMVGHTISRSERTQFPLYDLTLRGWIAALVLTDGSDAEIRDYSKAMGRSTSDKTLEVLRKLAENDDFRPIVKEALLGQRGEFTERLVSLDSANDFLLSLVLWKNLKLKFNVGWKTVTKRMLATANRWLVSNGSLPLHKIPQPTPQLPDQVGDQTDTEPTGEITLNDGPP